MLYSPIFFTQVTDLNLTQYHDCHIDMEYLNSKTNIIIYSLHTMNYLNKLLYFLNEVTKPFILISAMEDCEFPLEIERNFLIKINSNIFFKHWFSINKTIPNNEKFTSIPYGLDFWTLTTIPYFGENIQSVTTQNYRLQSVINETSHFSQRIPKIYANFHLNLTDERYGGWRSKLVNIIPKNIIFYESSRLPRNDSFIQTSKYTFVVSPFGNGLDCIRTFEALCLGCIVIMKRSCLDVIMYEDLPILLVDEWHEINETLLNDTIISYSNKKFNYEKLKFKYWADLVKNTLIA